MKIPKNADLQLKTDDGTIELHVTAAINTKQAAEELLAAIQRLSGALPDKPKRTRKPKPVATAA
jgi:hypothetical protein